MKTLSIVWSFVLATLFFTSCQTEDLATPMAHGHSELKAAKGGPQSVTVTYGGQATGLNATITTMNNGTVVSNQTILSQTGMLPLSGGSLNAGHSGALIEGVLSADSLNASITGQGK